MTDCPCCSEPWVLGEQSAEGDTPWNGTVKLYLYAGKVSSTIITSNSPGLVGTMEGHSQDGADTYVCEVISISVQRLVRLSGQFTSTVRDSLDVTSLVANEIADICWSGSSTYWQHTFGTLASYFVEQSGNFTSTVRQSVTITTAPPLGLTIDAVDTLSARTVPSSDEVDFYRYSGQFTTTLRSTFRNSDNVRYRGYMKFDGVSTVAGMTEAGVGNIIVYSGAFTSTVQASANNSADATLTGISSNITNFG